MELHTVLESKLSSKSDLDAGVKKAISVVEDWVGQVPMLFFPEYTRHDNLHNQEVLNTALDIATEASIDPLSPQDIAVLVGAVLLHDSAMHITEDGFLSLVSDNSVWKPISGLDTIVWPELWQEYLLEASRFDEKKLQQILGDAATPARRPPDDYLNWTDRDKRLVGEFIRRHHTRLAHEIALYGIPGKDGTQVPIFMEGFPIELADLSGLVARSHGLDLRDTFSYLSSKYDLREFQSVHSIYLMTLLRIADYLQIQPDRAPNSVLNLRRLRSPLSEQEWNVHASITNITLAGLDPEAIQIDANPDNAATFVRVRNWLFGIQSELDVSWAVLGEVYGRFSAQGFEKFGLKLRRVRSNIDDVESFQASADYIPDVISFKSAGTDLLKLLVKPLYGGDVAIGVRELVQNSVDAIREIREISLGEITDRKSDSPDVSVRLIYSVDGKPEYLEVEDNGIGMNIDVLKNYFLNAGASFRKSDAWKQSFEDQDSKSKIARSGRFGVGALAAFLLGNEIEVQTRRFTESADNCLSFSALLDDEYIDIRKSKGEIGTKIRIKLTSAAADHLLKTAPYSLFWYWPADPVVKVEIGDREFQPSDRQILPSLGEKAASGWASVDVEEYQQVNWTYLGSFQGPVRISSLFCNGIPINEVEKASSYFNYAGRKLYISKTIDVPTLVISIYDFDAKLPLNLARSSLMQFPDSLAAGLNDALATELVVACLCSEEIPTQSNPDNWQDCAWYGNVFNSPSNHRQIRASDAQRRATDWVFTSRGLLPYDTALLKELGIDFLYQVPCNDDLRARLIRTMQDNDVTNIGVFGLFRVTDAPTYFVNYMRQLYGRSASNDAFLRTSCRHDQIECLGGFAHSDLIRKNRQIAQCPKWLSEKIDLMRMEDWISFGAIGESCRPIFDTLEGVLNSMGSLGKDSSYAVVYKLAKKKEDQTVLSFEKKWFELVGESLLPYDSSARRDILSKLESESFDYENLRA